MRSARDASTWSSYATRATAVHHGSHRGDRIGATADIEVELDCSAVESIGAVEGAVIGMLVVVARASQRNGTRVALVNTPKPMRAQFEAAGVARLFDWRG